MKKFGITSFKLYTHHKGPLGRGILMDILPDADCEDSRDVNVDTGLLLEIFRTLQQLARSTSLNAARAFGLYPRKGTLLPGSDADFVMVDPDRIWHLTAKNWLSAADFNIYEEMELKRAVKSVYLGGVKVYEDGHLLGKPGQGRYLRRDR